MNKKCDKYESLFLFNDEKTLLEHIEQCEDCRKEHEKMQKVAALVKEAKPEFDKRQNIFTTLKVACVLFAFMTTGAFFQMYNPIIQSQMSSSTISSNTDESIIAEMGLPTDEYGLLKID